METLFAEIKRYVEWGREDEQSLRRLHVEAAPHFARIADQFYERILTHEGARQALVGGESRVGHLKVTLIAWMDRLLSGPWDEEYFALRCRIGRVHVRIALPQHYMFGAMNQLRRELDDVIVSGFAHEAEALNPLRGALGKVLDLELAIMLHTYREDLLSQQQQQERLATFGQLVGSIGHELRNPLGVIESSLYILEQRAGEDARSRKHLERIGEQVRVSNGIINALLDMIRDRPLVRTPVSLAATVASVLGALMPPAGVRIRLEGLDALPTIDADAGQLRTVVMNLVENAIAAAGDAKIRGPASICKRCGGCSSPWSPPRRAAWGWAWRWSSASWLATTAPSPTRRARRAALASSCGCRSGKRKADDEARAADRAALVLDGAAVLRHRRVHHGQPEPGAGVLGGEEGIEDALQHLVGDAGAAVLDRQRQLRRCHARLDAHPAAGRRRLNCVQHQVHERLLQPPLVGLNRRQRIDAPLQAELRHRRLRLEQRSRSAGGTGLTR